MAVGGKERVRGVARGLADQEEKEVETMPWKEGRRTERHDRHDQEGEREEISQECNDDCAFSVVVISSSSGFSRFSFLRRYWV